MNPTEKALWFVESHLPEAISLDDVAQSSGVSRFHVTRAFGAATGRSVMGYMRSRRLTEAARKLASGAPDILAVALDAGYASHEAFTRAFRDQFGTTPELVRAQGSLGNLDLVGRRCCSAEAGRAAAAGNSGAPQTAVFPSRSRRESLPCATDRAPW